MSQFWEDLKTYAAVLRAKALLILAAVAGVLFVLWRREKNTAAQAEAKQVAGEKKGESHELDKEIKTAEQEAADSRARYEQLAKPHRDGG